MPMATTTATTASTVKKGRKSPRLFRDPRDFQILYLSSFLAFGIFYLDWTADITKYFTIMGTCLGVQAIGIHFTTKNYRGLKSALITALGLCLLLKANSHWTLALAATVAIGSKFIIRIKGKHLFNPANFGIIAAILITGDAWISPGQWGNEAMLTYFFGGAALIVLFRVGRIDTSLAFLGTYFMLEFCRTYWYLGWEMDHFLMKFQNGSLLLFTFFMITDPMTTPNHKMARIIWGAGVAGLTFILTSWFYLHTAPIWALIIITPTVAILDLVFKGKKYNWDDPLPKMQWFKRNASTKNTGAIAMGDALPNPVQLSPESDTNK